MNTNLELSKEEYLDEIDYIYNKFIDNYIDVNEMKFQLSEIGFEFPNEFYSLSIEEQKQYMCHHRIFLSSENNEFTEYYLETYNKHYFELLSSLSKKNKKLTQKLIDYTNDFSFGNINLIFWSMNYIYVRYTDLMRYDNVKEYILNNNISTVYDLIVSVFSHTKDSDYLELKENLKEIIIKDKWFQIDIDKKQNKFYIHMECILSLLPKKESNILKLYFCILNEDYLNVDEDYYDIKIIKSIFNKIKKIVPDNLITKASSYYYNYIIKEKNFNPDGYFALFLFLIKEE